MNDPQNILKLLKELKGWSISGDVLLLVVICAAIFIMYHWQKNQIKSLKDYIKLWNPTQLKQDVNSYLELKDQINEDNLEQLRVKLSQAKDKESEALKIAKDYETRLWEMYLDLYQYKKPDIGNFKLLFPKDSEVTDRVTKDDVMWTVKFRNGVIKRFKLPVKPDKKADS